MESRYFSKSSLDDSLIIVKGIMHNPGLYPELPLHKL